MEFLAGRPCPGASVTGGGASAPREACGHHLGRCDGWACVLSPEEMTSCSCGQTCFDPRHSGEESLM